MRRSSAAGRHDGKRGAAANVQTFVALRQIFVVDLFSMKKRGRKADICLFAAAALLSGTCGAGIVDDAISAEAAVELSSRKVFYGYALNREPIWIPQASVTLFDTLTAGVIAYCDMTDWGSQKRRGPSGYGDRSWRYQEIDPYVSLRHTFSPSNLAWLPMSVALSACYQYEYDPPFPNGDTNPDSHYVKCGIGLPDLWLEPALNAEFDIDRDHGIYLNLDVGHSFPLAGSDESPALALRADVSQGWGDANRNDAYTGVNRTGLMDTMIRLTIEWTPCPWLRIAPYAAYYEYLFDPHLRDGARCIGYGAGRKTESWNFIGGVRIAVSF